MLALSDLGRTAPAAGAAQVLVREQPLREGYWRRLMLTSYQDGRQADALAAYGACRTLLDDELGMSPDEDTEALHLAILRRDPSLRPTATAIATAAATAAAPLPPREWPGPVPPSPVGPETLIGREPQLARIGAALDAAGAGTGWLVVLEGEAGIGKTRLAESARELARSRGFRTVWGATMRDMAAPPLWPWEQTLRALDLPMPAVGAPGDDPATARFRLCQGVADTLLDAARDEPLLIVLDDLHWADALSLQVLRLLAAQLSRFRCVVVTTWRTGDGAADPAVESAVAALDRELTVRRIPIPPLTPDQVEALLARHTPGGGADPVELYRRTGGNLFYLVELVRLLDNRVAGDEVPASVQSVVEQRHDVLPLDTRRVLRLAALAGEQLDLRVLARAAGLEPAPLVEALEPAQRSGLLRQGRETLRWRFAHDIARQALVTRIGPSERARLHGVLAEAIGAVYGTGSGAVAAAHLDDLAQHLFHAAHGTTSEAAYLACEAAADHARAWLAPDRAARHRERALGVLPEGDSADRRFRTLLALSEEHGMAGDNGASTVAVADALAVARAAHHDTHETVLHAAGMLGRVTLWTWELPAPVEAMVIGALRGLLATDVTPRRRAVLLGTLAQRLNLAGADRGEVERTARDGVDIARRLGDTALLGQALNGYVRAAWYPEREAERLAATEEALSLVGRGLPAVTEIIARMHRMPILLRAGRLPECERELEASGELARSVGVPEAEAHATYHQITWSLLRGEWASAEQGIDAAYRRFERSGFGHAEMCRVAQRSALARATGRLGEVASELLDIGDSSAYGESLRPTAVLALAESGDHDLALRSLHRWGLAHPPRTSSWFTDFTTVELGEVAARLGSPDPARFHELLSARSGQLGVMGTLQICAGPVDLTLARLAHRLGRVPDARRHLAEAAEAYGRVPGFAHGFASVARLLDRPSGLPPSGLPLLGADQRAVATEDVPRVVAGLDRPQPVQMGRPEG